MAEDLKRILGAILARINDLERKMPSSDQREETVVLEETHLPEDAGGLGRRSLLTNSAGGIRRVVRHPVCDCCGISLSNGNFIVCPVCRRKICESCSLRFEGETLCPRCLRELLPLDKSDFKLLLLLAVGVRKISEITEYAGMGREDILTSIEKLRSHGLVGKMGFSIFSKTIVSDRGFSALSAYLKIFGRELDVIELLGRLKADVCHLKKADR